TRYTPALTFRFPLDKFQRQAIAHMELETPRAAVFVAAHTGSGKTVIAEYAIAMALASKSRAVYSSPFKALCNQKFYDLRKAFRSYGDDAVGLITGDTVINADASILVMTTEVLRSMLYNSSSVIREISWVVFDEIHYITNEERGLAYEEVLLMLPRSVGLIFLSATSPNKEEFGEWVGTVKQQPVFIVSTNKRTVPLRHYIAVGGSLFPVLEGAQHEAVPGTGWSQEKFAAACAAAARHSGSTQPGSFFSLPMVQDEEPFGKAMLEALRKEDLLPAIVFCSAIALCFDYARMALQWNVCLLDSGEVAEVNSFLRRSMESMPREGVDLPQVEEVRRLLCAGIGVHNAGLMPILKEVTELLFARGKLKLLFATESVATGMNLPARAVLFKGLFKVRDKNVRDTIKPTEYQQMAGRAGRRGIDETGAVIVSLPRLQAAAQPKVREIMSGAAEQLRSQFRLTYHMILNVLRADIPVTRFLERSFVQKRNTPMPLLTEARVQWRQGARLRDQWNALLSKYEEADVSAAVQGVAPATASPAEHGKMLHLMLSNYASMDKHLCPGRVVVLRRVLVNPAKLNGADPAAAAAATKELYYVPAVILQRASGAGAAGAPAEASGWGSPVVIGSSATALTPDQQAATRFHMMLLTP
ncbi:MAG: DEAD/DEAH box helicase, partial [Methanobacteriota archaeon]